MSIDELLRYREEVIVNCNRTNEDLAAISRDLPEYDHFIKILTEDIRRIEN